MTQAVLDLGTPTEELTYYEPDGLIPWPGLNPRRRFDPKRMEELEGSLRENGVLQNIVVQDVSEMSELDFQAALDRAIAAGVSASEVATIREIGKDDCADWVVAGESRWRCASRIPVRLPARVRLFSEAQALRIALLENLQRNDLTPTEEAHGFKRMLELEPDLTQEQIAQEFSVDPSYVSNRIRLLELPESVQQLIDAGVILPTHARDHLLAWTKEANAEGLFGALLGMINSRPDPTETVSLGYLVPLVAKLSAMLGAKPEQQQASAEKAAEVEAKPAVSRGKKATKKAAAKKQAPGRPEKKSRAAAEPTKEAPPQDPATDPPAPADDEPPASTTTTPAEEESEAGEAQETSAGPVSEQETTGELFPEEVAAAAPPPAELVLNLTSALPLLNAHSLNVQLTEAVPGQVILVLAPKHKKNRAGISPRTMHGTPAEVAERLPETLRLYVADILGEEAE